MDFKKALPLIFNFISWATPKRVIMLALVSFVSILSLTLFEHRSSLLTAFNTTESAPREVSLLLADDTKQKIKELVIKSPDINTIMIINADIRVNQREMVYYFTDDSSIDFIIKNYLKIRSAKQPIFSADEKNNAQMVAVINGEFGCYKYEDSTTNMLLPKVGQYTAAICRISLPPYYGEFSGYLNVLLTHMPDAELQSEVRIEAVRLATEIYFKSIKHRD